MIGPYVHGYREGSEQPEEALYASAGVARICPLSSDDERFEASEDFHIMTPQIAPGLAWQWEQLRADSEGFSTAVDVAGATDAFAAD